MTDPFPARTGYDVPPTAGSGGTDSTDASVKDKATESAQAGKEAVGDVAKTAAGQAKEVADEAKTQARDLAGEARTQLRNSAGEQHRNAVSNLRSLSEELRSMAGSSEQNGVATDLVSQAADRTHSVADWLDQRRPEDLLDEVRRFARRRPGAFLLGALAAGMVAGRLTRGAVAAHSDDDNGAHRADPVGAPFGDTTYESASAGALPPGGVSTGGVPTGGVMPGSLSSESTSFGGLT